MSVSPQLIVPAAAFPIGALPNNNPPIGQYQRNGKFYVVTVDQTDGSDDFEFSAYRSATGLKGSWTRIATGPIASNLTYAYYPNSGGQFVYLVFNNGSAGAGLITVLTFDLDGEDFTTPVVSPFTLLAAVDLFIGVNGSGGVVIVWDDVDNALAPTKSTVFASVYSGGLWSSAVTVSNQAWSFAQPFAVNGGGNPVLVWSQYHDAGGTRPATAIFSNVLTGTVVGARSTVLVDASKIWTKDWFPVQQPIYDVASDSIAYPVVINNGHGNPYQVALLLGSPSANPAWSMVVVATSTDVADDSFDLPCIAKGPGQLVVVAGLGKPTGFTGTFAGNSCYVFDAQTVTGYQIYWMNDAASQQVLISTATALAGPWSPYSVFWDESLTPPSPTIVSANGIFGLSAFVPGAPITPLTLCFKGFKVYDA